MSLYVIRHGETEMGKNRIIATMDELLNPYGIEQAIAVGREIRKLKLDRIFCSPIQRAKDTLHYFNLSSSIPVYYEPRIIERDVGNYEKISFDALDWDSFWNYNSQIKYPDCESMSTVYNRVKQFLDELKQDNTDENILLVTHGGISRVIYWYFNGIPEDGHSSNINENCKIYEYHL